MWKIYKQSKNGLVYITSTSDYGVALTYKTAGYIIQDNSQYTNDTSIYYPATSVSSADRLKEKLAQVEAAKNNLLSKIPAYNAANNVNVTYPDTNQTIKTNPLYIATIITFLILLAIWSTY